MKKFFSKDMLQKYIYHKSKPFRLICSLMLCFFLAAGVFNPIVHVEAKGPVYTELKDIYFTKETCTVYAEPTYTSLVLTTIAPNVPVQVLGKYSNGWYRISIGVIAYVKMDSLTTSGAVGIINQADKQLADAQATAKELGYEFVNITLNKRKTIKKDVFNSYIDKKAILYVKLDDEVAVSFKMLYADKVTKDINLNFAKNTWINSYGERVVEVLFDEDTELFGQIAIFQFREGYDKAVTIEPTDLTNTGYVYMNTYYTEFSEFAYAPMTQISDIRITEAEIENSLTEATRAKMADFRKGIKYLSDDSSEYKESIGSRLRKDTEYVDFYY